MSIAAPEGAHVLGQEYITWPLVDEGFRTIDKFKVIAERLNIAGAQIKKAGLQLAYHNHDFEFVEQNGQIGYDIILKETDPALVKCRWTFTGSRADRNPAEPVVQAAPRTFRDVACQGRAPDESGLHRSRERDDRLHAHLARCPLAGLKHFFVEQGGNFTHDPFRSVADSAEYAKRVLLK